jgi:hypothetical protein
MRAQKDYGLNGTESGKPLWFTSYYLTLSNVQDVIMIDDQPERYRWEYKDGMRILSEFPFWLEAFKKLRTLEVWIQRERERSSRRSEGSG